MSDSAAGVRQRGKKKSPGGLGSGSEDEPLISKTHVAAAYTPPAKPHRGFKIALAVLTGLAFATRFWGIGHPNEVVFDEVHFGKVGQSCPPVLKDRVLMRAAVCVLRESYSVLLPARH
jgi:dolichyl-phosphate-mannose-protein mannosyltransferase